MEQNRVFLAIILSLAIIFLYPYFLNMIYPQKHKIATKKIPLPLSAEKPAESKGIAKRQEGVEEKRIEGLNLKNEKLVVIDTPIYRATLSSAGGGIKSWVLKRYRTRIEPESRKVDLIPPLVRYYSFTSTAVDDAREVMINFKPTSKNLKISAGGSSAVIFEGVSPEGLKVEKRYIFSGSDYMVDAEFIIHNDSDRRIKERLKTNVTSFSLPPAGPKKKRRYSYHIGTIVYENGEIKRIKPGKEKKVIEGKPEWIGIEDKYFLTALIPLTRGHMEYSSAKVVNGVISAAFYLPVDLMPGGNMKFRYKAYIGPKEFKRLKASNLRLEESIEFGFFAFLARPMLMVLDFFYRFVRNYGLAIILLTIVIKIVFYPLSKHSIKSMKDMQKIQPQMAALKEKYKDDKQRLNKELMDLYKRQKINPLGGCLPMVLQIPVFIALYEVLYVTIELRHAPLFLWIKDLSAPDTLLRLPEGLPLIGGSAFGPLPLLMGLTMYIQQKMTPTSVDPAQAKMMLFMPIIFTFMFLNFPTGLVLYWLINNILQIGQQYYIQKSIR